MNTLKKTLALVATLAMAATAFVGCGKEDEGSSSDNSSNNSTPDNSTVDDNSTPDDGSDVSTPDDGSTGEVDASVGQGGAEFVVAAWDANDAPKLIAQWKGLDYDKVTEQLENNEVEGVKFLNMSCKGGEAAENYDQRFNDGTDIDVFFVEADWALKFINDDARTLPLSKLGLSESDFSNAYSYTKEIGKSTSGELKGVSWQAAAGGFAYRADLAEEYLGATSPAQMQEKVGDWAKFTEAAKTISDATSGSVALGDTLGGMWQVYACGRTTPWVKDNKLQIDDFCKDFADTAKELWDMGGITKNDQWSNEWTASGVQGSTMGYFVSTWGFGGFFLEASGGVGGAQYGKWNVCQGPQAFYWGGTWLVANADTDNGNECREFILSAAGDDAQMKEYATKKPEFVNNKAVMDEIIAANTVFDQDTSGNFKDGQNFFAELAGNVEKINFNGLITEHDATIKTDFVTAVKEEYLMGGKSWDDTVKRFKTDVAKDVVTIEIE